MSSENITSVAREGRKFTASRDFQAQANIGSIGAYRRLYSESVNNPEKVFYY